VNARLLPLAGLLALLTLGTARCADPPAPRWDPASGTPLPGRVRLPVRGKAQRRSLSCESRSSADLLAAYGIALSEDGFRTGLPVSDNPDLGFVGDVDGPGEQLPPAGYGVHAEPIAARLREAGLPARAYRGRDLAWLRRQLAAGRPVIVWATGQLDAPAPVRLRDARGRSFVAVRGEHTYLAVGYEPGSVFLVDAATGREREVFDQTFDASWAALGRMAVVAETAPPNAP
jgi:uncharacterized protein YvpB